MKRDSTINRHPPATVVRDSFTWLAYMMLGYYAYSQAALGPAMPFLRERLDVSYAVGALHPSAFAVGMIAVGLFGDRVVRGVGRPLTFWGGAGGMAVGAVLVALGPHIVLTLLGAFAMGTMGSLLLVALQAALADRHGERRATVLTEANVVASVSAMLAPVAVGVFAGAAIGWPAAFFLVLPLLAFFAIEFRDARIPGARSATRDASNLPVKLPLSFWLYWWILVLGVAVEWSIVFWSADFLSAAVGFDTATAAALMTLFFGAMVAGRLAGSRLTLRHDTGLLIVAVLALTAVGFALFWLVPWPWVKVLGLFTMGFGIANVFPFSLAAAVGTDPSQSDAATARASLGAGLAILLAPLLLGWTADQVGVTLAYGTIAPLLLMALAVAYINRKAV